MERSFAWLARNRRFTKDHEYRVQTSDTLLGITTIRLILNFELRLLSSGLASQRGQ
jgi:hypothetical protein